MTQREKAPTWIGSKALAVISLAAWSFALGYTADRPMETAPDWFAPLLLVPYACMFISFIAYSQGWQHGRKQP